MQTVTKESSGGHTHIRPNRPKFENGYKRQRTGYINNTSVQENITIINISTRSDRPSNDRKQTLTELKGDIASRTVTVGDARPLLATAGERPD